MKKKKLILVEQFSGLKLYKPESEDEKKDLEVDFVEKAEPDTPDSESNHTGMNKLVLE